MYKTTKIVALASVFALVLLGGLAYANETGMGFDYNTYWAEAPSYTGGAGYATETAAESPAVHQPVAGEETDMGPYNTYTAEPPVYNGIGLSSFATEKPRNVNPAMYPFAEIEASSMIGYRVLGPRDVYLGQISDFIVDQTHDRIALVILSGVPQMGYNVAIPFSMLERTPGGFFTIKFPPGSPDLGFQNDFDNSFADALAPGEVHGVIDPSFVAWVYDHFQVAPYWAESDMGTSAECLISYNKLLRDDIAFAQAGNGTRVDDLVFDFPNGHIPLLVLRDVPGRGDALVAVPFSFLTRNADNTFALDISSDHLASAPIFNDYTDNVRAYTMSVYRFYGLQPYWTDDMMNY